MRVHRLAAFSLSLTLLACKAPSDEQSSSGTDPNAPSSSAAGDFDYKRFETAAEAKMGEVLERPSVDAAMTGAWDVIGSDPAVGSAGEAMLAAIGSHPKFTPVANELMAKLQTSPAFLALVTSFMAANPGMDMTGFEAAFGQHVSAQIERPEVQQALDASIGRLVDKPEIQVALSGLVHAITVESGVSQEIGRNISAKLDTKEVMAQLEAKVGVKPGDADYGDKMFAYLTEDAKLEAFMLGFAELFAKHPAPRKAVVELLNNQAVIDATSEQVANMMRGPSFFPLAEAAMVAALDGSDRASVEAKLDALVAQPEVAAAFAAWVAAIGAVPEVKDGFADAFRQLFADPEFSALLMKTFVGA